MNKNPLLSVKNLRQHFEVSRNFTVKAVNGVSFETTAKSRLGAALREINFEGKSA